MKKLIYAINMTLDGCVDHTKFNPDEETMPYFVQLTRDAGAFLYGRKTYELMVPYWPDIANDPSEQGNSDYEFAQAFDAVEKIVVFSKSLGSADGEKTKIIRSGLRDEVLKLKQEDGGDILTGGVAIPAQLAELGLIDEYRFVIYPIVVGEGRRLFDSITLPEKLRLKLVESTVFTSGAVALRYLKQ